MTMSQGCLSSPRNLALAATGGALKFSTLSCQICLLVAHLQHTISHDLIEMVSEIYGCHLPLVLHVKLESAACRAPPGLPNMCA